MGLGETSRCRYIFSRISGAMAKKYVLRITLAGDAGASVAFATDVFASDAFVSGAFAMGFRLILRLAFGTCGSVRVRLSRFRGRAVSSLGSLGSSRFPRTSRRKSRRISAAGGSMITTSSSSLPRKDFSRFSRRCRVRSTTSAAHTLCPGARGGVGRIITSSSSATWDALRLRAFAEKPRDEGEVRAVRLGALAKRPSPAGWLHRH